VRSNYGQIAGLVALVLRSGVQGDFAEMGVWQGTTFLPLAETAAGAGRRCHAVDSFRGCLSPGPRDTDERGRVQYRAGALDVGGSHLFRQLVAPLGDSVLVWEGWIPPVLDQVDSGMARLAFAHIDLDQYEPTLYALRWCWDRLSPGGIVCCHDWIAGRRCLAAGAMNDWLAEMGCSIEADGASNEASWGSAGVAPGNHAWIRKAAR
jgi:hypothetical protein